MPIRESELGIRQSERMYFRETDSRSPVPATSLRGSRGRRSCRSPASVSSVLRRPGGYSGEPKPDPIPNSAVKFSCANGTKSRRLGRVGRCQACQGQEKPLRDSDFRSETIAARSLRWLCTCRPAPEGSPLSCRAVATRSGKEAGSSQWLGSLLHRPRAGGFPATFLTRGGAAR